MSESVFGYQYSSYRVGGIIDQPCFPTTLEEAIAMLNHIRETKTPLTVLGRGSNTIIASQGIRGATFLAKRLMFLEEKTPNTLLIGAGMPLAKVCKIAQDRHLSGVEFMIGIPGTLGGAVTMNAGAMGQETAETLDFAILYNLESGDIETWTAEALAFSYRNSAIDPQKRIVLAAQLTMQSGDPQHIEQLIRESLTFRQTHHPKEPNGGSVFKNPSPDQPVGRLLDQTGAKSWVEGGASVSPLHANFIVNTGTATSTDILRLMMRMKTCLAERYGIDAHPENRFLGDATDEERDLWLALTGQPVPRGQVFERLAS